MGLSAISTSRLPGSDIKTSYQQFLINFTIIYDNCHSSSAAHTMLANSASMCEDGSQISDLFITESGR